MRLIDVDVFAAELKERHENIMQDSEVSKRMKWCEAVHYGATTAIIEKMPTIEAAPVVHGYWVDHYICSNCGKRSTDGLDADVWTSYEPPFCPNCSAKMDGGVSDG